MRGNGGRHHESPPLPADLEPTLQALFQPLVDLGTGEIVGYEALVRGPAERGLDSPQALFAAARAQGRVRELDWAARGAAVAAARAAGVRHPLSIFINAEPEALRGPPGGSIEEWRQMGDLRCFAEITERALTARPGDLLRLADAVRGQDWGIALDDIGANPATVALMPMLQPDVLKLDLSLLHQHDRLEVAQTTHAVMTQAEDTGATVVAEGVETEQQRDLAVALGARLGQGWFLGSPAALPAPLPVPALPIGLLSRLTDRVVTPSPYAVVNDVVAARRGRRPALQAVWAQLLAQARTVTPSPVLFAVFPDRSSFDTYAGQLAALADDLALLAVFGPPGALPADTGAAPLRAQALDADDPADQEWNLVIVGATYAAALVARPLATASGDEAEYEFVLTFSRPLAVRAANALLMRLTELEADPADALDSMTVPAAGA